MNESPESTDAPAGPLPVGWNHPVWLGLLVVFMGFVSYFIFFAYYPTLRDFPWLNLPVIILGLLISAWGVWVAFDRRRTVVGKLGAAISFLFSAAIAALFGFYVFYWSYQLPADTQRASSNDPAPGFELRDQHDKPVALSDYAGRKVVVVFYRGYW